MRFIALIAILAGAAAAAKVEPVANSTNQCHIYAAQASIPDPSDPTKTVTGCQVAIYEKLTGGGAINLHAKGYGGKTAATTAHTDFHKYCVAGNTHSDHNKNITDAINAAVGASNCP